MQRTDDRNAAADTCLKQNVDVVLTGGRQQLGSLLGDQLFVGSSDALAVLQAGADHLKGGMHAAHHLDNDVDFRVVCDGVKVKAELVLPGQLRMRTAHIEVFDVQLTAGFALDAGAVFIKDLDHTGTDGAAAEDGNFFHRGKDSLQVGFADQETLLRRTTPRS